MSVFDDVPDPFPFDAVLSKRPATFVLHPDRADRYIIGFIALFWLVFGPALTALIAALFVSLAGLMAYMGPIIAASIAVAIAVYIWWWWQEFNGSFRVVNVTISDDRVGVHERDLIRNRSWSHPLSDFEGVVLVNLGTRLVGDSKIPLLSVLLKHPDPTRSIPLAIGEPSKIGRRTVERKAKQLGLAALEGIAGASGAAAYPPDTVVVNRYQALKLRLLYWGFVAAALFFAGGTIYQHIYTEIDPAWPIMAVICVAVVGVMHVFARQYVLEMKECDGEIALRTASRLFPWRRFPRKTIRSLDYRAGRTRTVRHSVYAPWVKMRVAGYRLPFMIDMQSDFVDVNRLRGLGLRAR